METLKRPVDAARPDGEAGGVRRDDDDLSYKNHQASSSTSRVAKGAGRRRQAPVAFRGPAMAWSIAETA